MALNFARLGTIRPELLSQQYELCAPVEVVTEYGRHRAEYAPRGCVCCIQAATTPQEQERFRQREVTITHKLVQRGAPMAGENWLMRHVRTGKAYRVKAVEDQGMLGIDTVYYCEERGDGQ